MFPQTSPRPPLVISLLCWASCAHENYSLPTIPLVFTHFNYWISSHDIPILWTCLRSQKTSHTRSCVLQLVTWTKKQVARLEYKTLALHTTDSYISKNLGACSCICNCFCGTSPALPTSEVLEDPDMSKRCCSEGPDGPWRFLSSSPLSVLIFFFWFCFCIRERLEVQNPGRVSCLCSCFVSYGAFEITR